MPAQLIFGDVTILPPDDLKAALKDTGLTRIDTAARYQNGVRKTRYLSSHRKQMLTASAGIREDHRPFQAT